MIKPRLLYYVHAHGAGHRATFDMLFPEISRYFEIIALTTNGDITHYLRKYNIQIIELPAKYSKDYTIPEHTFSKPFEVTPYAVEPSIRAESLAKCLKIYKPTLFYCHGSPELAIMVRGMGVPVVLIHQPGNTSVDPTQVFAYELADHVIARFPKEFEQSDYLYSQKTMYSGYLSKYSNVYLNRNSTSDNVTVLLGFDTYSEKVMKAMTHNHYKFTIIGNKHTYDLGPNCRQLGRADNVAEAITGDIVITAAGQNTIGELLSLHKKLVILPEPRPYDEQLVHAEVLANRDIAILAKQTFNESEWISAIDSAKMLQPNYDSFLVNDASTNVANALKEWYV